MTIRGGGGGGADDDLLLSQDLLNIEFEDEDASQQAPSQNTLVVAAEAINGLTSPFGLPPLTEAGSPSTEEIKEDEITANMPLAEVVPRGDNCAAIEHRLDQASQERQNAAQVTPSILRRADNLRQNLSVRFGIV